MALLGRLARPSVLRTGARNVYVYGERQTFGCTGGALGNPAPVNSELPIYRNTEIDALVEKAKGDWKAMTPEEIKKLYKAHFLESVEDATAYTGGVWRLIGQLMFCGSIALWGYMFFARNIGPQKCPTMTYTHKLKSLEFDVRSRHEAPKPDMVALRAAMEPDLERQRQKLRDELQLEEKYKARVAHLLDPDGHGRVKRREKKEMEDLPPQ